MPSTYFSDRERGGLARSRQDVDSRVWGGIVALVNEFVANGGFGIDYPDPCPDGQGPVGTNELTLALAVRAELPALDWPLAPDVAPDTMTVMDFLEFCHDHVAAAKQGHFHSFFRHYHLGFDREAGQIGFRERVNRILSRNDLAYELKEDGTVVRLGPPVFQEALVTAVLKAGTTS